MQLLDGKSCSEQIRQEIAQTVSQLKTDGQRAPHLAAVLVGNDGASQNYVAFKVKDCEEIGFESTTIRLEDSISEQELLCLLYTSPSPRDRTRSRMPSSA